MEVLKSHLYQISLVFVAEVFADWIKHAFITKVAFLGVAQSLRLPPPQPARSLKCSLPSQFNVLSSDLYADFMFVLARDVTETRHNEGQPILDHTHSVTRRVGLAQLPFACIFCRFIQVRAAYQYPPSARALTARPLRAGYLEPLLLTIPGCVDR